MGKQLGSARKWFAALLLTTVVEAVLYLLHRQSAFLADSRFLELFIITYWLNIVALVVVAYKTSRYHKYDERCDKRLYPLVMIGLMLALIINVLLYILIWVNMSQGSGSAYLFVVVPVDAIVYLLTGILLFKGKSK